MLEVGGSSDAATEPRLHPIDALVGVLTAPVTTLRAIAIARPWPWALALEVGAGLLGGLAALTAPDPALSADPTFTPPEMMALLVGMRSPAFVLVSALILGPIGLIVGSAILYGLGRLFGGRGRFAGLLSAVGFTSVPSILVAPISAWLNLAGGLFTVLNGLVGLGFAVWALVLQVIAVRESLSLTTGRAVLTVLLPLAALMLLLVVFVLIFVVAAVGRLASGGV